MLSATSATLMYHDVVPTSVDWDRTGFPGASAADYKISEENFNIHLKALKSASVGPPLVVTDRSAASSSDCSNSWMITFDDGGDTAASTAAPLLDALDWRAHFFVTTSKINTAGFLSDTEIKELVSQGHVVGAHSHSHPLRFASLPKVKMEDEWKRSCAILESIIGVPTTVASVPGGLYSREVAEAASSAGIRWLFTSEPTIHLGQVGDCRIIGRFAMRRSTTAIRAVKLVGGPSLARLQESLSWKLKGIVKKIGGDFYLRIRERLFEFQRD